VTQPWGISLLLLLPSDQYFLLPPQLPLSYFILCRMNDWWPNHGLLSKTALTYTLDVIVCSLLFVNYVHTNISMCCTMYNSFVRFFFKLYAFILLTSTLVFSLIRFFSVMCFLLKHHQSTKHKTRPKHLCNKYCK